MTQGQMRREYVGNSQASSNMFNMNTMSGGDHYDTLGQSEGGMQRSKFDLQLY